MTPSHDAPKDLEQLLMALVDGELRKLFRPGRRPEALKAPVAESTDAARRAAVLVSSK